MSESLRQRTFTLAVLSSFAVVSLLLAAVGIYGVVCYSVSSRAREIGIRLALGADPKMVRGRFFASSITVVAAGVAVGIVIALVAGRMIESLLYGVSTRDLSTLFAAPAVLLVTASIAIAVPVMRYTRIDAVEVMRAE